MPLTLTERQRSVFFTIVQDHVLTGEPVGSRMVARKSGLGLSPATIRNVMTDLEEMGLITQPHASAGRVPTDFGYRHYVDSLTSLPRLQSNDLETLSRSVPAKVERIESLLEQTSLLLSQLSQHAGLVFVPRLSTIVFKQVTFTGLKPKQVLAVLVSEAGMTHTKVVEVDEALSQDKLTEMGNYLTSEFEGLSLRAVRAKVLEQMAEEKAEYDALLKKAIALYEEAFGQEVDDSPGEVIVEGASNILNTPEIQRDIEKMRGIFQAFEDKSRLVRLLDRCLTSDTLCVLIGEESEIKGLDDLSVVSQSYRLGDRPLGAVGIMGPKRMEYARVMALVDYTAKALSRLLAGEPV
ncbi:MAG: heat-inducible transcriptional repressor HrcA [Nitrospinota bacterium]